MKLKKPRLHFKKIHFRFNGRLLSILILTALAVWINLPRFPLQVNLYFKTFEFMVDHPTLTLGNFKRDLEPKLGLDLQGGTSIVLEADMSKVPQQDRMTALEVSRSVIERRVNLFGVSEPVVQSSRNGDSYRILVELAGVKDINEATSLVGKTAKLEFRAFDETQQASPSGMIANLESTVPTGLDGGDIKKSEVIFNPQTNDPQVGFTIQPQSQDKFFQATSKLVGKQMIIFLDDVAISAPVVQQAIRDNGQISGQFTLADAKQLSLQLNAGALKAPVKIVSQRNIGATLGEQSIHKSLIAGAIGLSLIALFMIMNYGKLGLIANVALVIYTLVSLAIFRFIPITLTLAGIAGFILSIGMAVDANILIFERMKEEIRWGKDRSTALRLGFERAMSSIKASNISTLITTLILYWFGTGIVRGFALTLALGVLVSMFSAIFVSRTLIRFFYRIAA